MRLLISILCLISIFICGYYNENSNYQSLILLPFSFLFFNLLNSFKSLRKSYVYYIFYFQALIRYCVIPIGIAMGDTLKTGNHSNNGNTAVFFMIVELLFIFVLFSYQNHKLIKIITSPKVVLVNKNIWIYGFVVLVFLIILNSGFFNRVNLIWDLSIYVEDVIVGGKDIESSSLGGLLFIPFKIALLLILASIILKSKIKQNFKILLLILLMGLSSSFIVGVSRLSIITFILPFYLILITLFDKKAKKAINLGLIIFLIPVILITSLEKFTRGDRVATTEDIFNTNSFNAYFAGVGNVAAGIDAFEDQPNKEYLSFFINDIFQNVPLLSKLTDNTYKSNYVFNKKIYGHSEWQTQIVPLSIAGLFHFNVFGIGLYSSLFLFLAFYFENKAKKESYLPYKYVFYSIMLTLAMVFMLNIGSMVVTIVRSLIFVYIPFYLSNKLYKLR